jgi:uncharacterized protein with PIN domain
MKGLLCDEMLQRLCRWLRAAGYDAALTRLGAADREVIDRAVAEDRLLITRDREFLDRREAHRVFYLATDDLAAQAAALRDALGIDWLHKPFSRCLLCNTELAQPPLHLRPPKAPSLLLHCPSCDKLYWEGTHVRRMREQLADWQRH